jgi:predicted metal-dependent hydrolase
MLALAERDVPLRVRQSERARRITLRIDAAAESIELVLPKRVSLAAGLRFLDSRREWVAANLAEMPDRIVFVDGAIVPVLGTPHRIRHLGGRSPGVRTVAIEEGEIRVVGAVPHVPRRVRDHLIALARQELSRRAREVAARIDRRVTRITVRDTTSRWGSCSASGALAFSWRLILAPEAVLDYVVAHEVAHLVHLDHGREFKALEARLFGPGLAESKATLRRVGPGLRRVGRG